MKKLRANRRHMKIYKKAIKAGKSHEEALRLCYAAKSARI